MSESPSRLYRIDALRALSVLLVVLGHAGLAFIPATEGVTIFFVISGFVITKLLLREKVLTNGFAYGPFLMRRFWKIFPPLLGCIILPSIILFSYLHLSKGAVASQTFFTFNYYWLLTHSGAGSEGGYLPGSDVVWSLSVEEQFYLLIAVAWLVISKSRNFLRSLKALLIVVVLTSTVLRLVLEVLLNDQMQGRGSRWVYPATECRISAIALGALLAIHLHTVESSKSSDSTWKNFMPLFLGVTLLGVALLLFAVLDKSKFPTTAIAITVSEWGALFLVLSALKMASWPKWLDVIAKLNLIQKFGLASYSIYLVHDVIIQNLVNKFPLTLPMPVPVIIKVTLGLSVGLLAHRCFDQPFEKQRAKWRIYKRTPVTS